METPRFGRPSKAEPLGLILRGVLHLFWLVTGRIVGGAPVAFEVAKELDAPLDVIVVRKLGLPFQPEFAMGAVSEGGVLVSNEEIMRMTNISHDEFAFVENRERDEVERRAKLFRGDWPALSLVGRIALIVDDGIATGSTAQAACQVARARGTAKVLLAVPVGSGEAVELLKNSDEEVIDLLNRATKAIPLRRRHHCTKVFKKGQFCAVEKFRRGVTCY